MKYTSYIQSFEIVIMETTLVRRILKLGLGENMSREQTDIPDGRRENKSREEIIFKTTAVTLQYKRDIYIFPENKGHLKTQCTSSTQPLSS